MFTHAKEISGVLGGGASSQLSFGGGRAQYAGEGEGAGSWAEKEPQVLIEG